MHDRPRFIRQSCIQFLVYTTAPPPITLLTEGVGVRSRQQLVEDVEVALPWAVAAYTTLGGEGGESCNLLTFNQLFLPLIT